MKRLIAIILAVCLLLAVPAMAENAPAALLETVKSRIGSTEDYEIFYSSNYTSQGKTIYSFNWEDNDGESYKSMFLSVTDSGIITDYNYYTEQNEREEKPTLDRLPVAGVQQAAEDFVARINPAIAAELVLSPRQTTQSLWSKNYSFAVQRTVNGIPVYGDTGSITVAQDGMTVTSFYVQYTEGLAFDSTAGVISQEQAQTAYAEKLGMQLQYLSRYENGKKTVYPAYLPRVQWGSYIDAKTGRVVTPKVPVVDVFNKEFGATTESAADSAAGNFTPAEQQEMDNIEGLKPISEIEALLRDNFLLSITDDMELQNTGLNKQRYGNRYLYSLRFRSADETASVTVDASSGQLFSYNRYGALKGTEVTDAVAKNMEINIGGTLAGEYAAQYRLDENSTSYIRYVNGVPYFDDCIRTEVDRKSGLLTYFHLSYTEVEFPSVEGALTPQQAAEKLFLQTEYSLVYIRDCTSDTATSYDKGALVYMLTDGAEEMDPFTGEIKTVQTAELPEYTDIAGHYGENAIATLRQFGIGFAADEFKPNATITQGEFLELLQVVFFGRNGVMLEESSDHTDALRTAVSHGVLASDDANLDAPLTRQTAAVYLVRAMGYGAVADMSEIFRCPFDDVTENVGHISILGAMGVFKGDGQGSFLPRKQLTRADAAVVLYNYLSA